MAGDNENEVSLLAGGHTSCLASCISMSADFFDEDGSQPLIKREEVLYGSVGPGKFLILTGGEDGRQWYAESSCDALGQRFQTFFALVQ